MTRDRPLLPIPARHIPIPGIAVTVETAGIGGVVVVPIHAATAVIPVRGVTAVAPIRAVAVLVPDRAVTVHQDIAQRTRCSM